MAKSIRVSVVYADSQRQIVRALEVADGASVAEAIRASSILEACPRGFEPAGLGIFGKRVAPETPVREGDQIELYRPLKIDPKEARRRRAKK